MVAAVAAATAFAIFFTARLFFFTAGAADAVFRKFAVAKRRFAAINSHI